MNAQRKKEVDRIITQAKDGFKKIGKEIGVIAKKGEKEILWASKTGKIQLDIMSLNVQKEKLFYDIGKKATGPDVRKKLAVAELEPYWKKMDKLEGDAQEKKELLARLRKEEKK